MRFGDYPKTVGQLSDCLIEYCEDEHNPQRFGQWLYNKYVRDAKPWTELFYETDVKEAYVIAMNEITSNENEN